MSRIAAAAPLGRGLAAAGLALLLACLPPSHAAAASREAQPRAATMRSVVFERTPSGYRWELTRAPIPRVGDHQVLVHVRAAALNRGDIELLTPYPGQSLAGLQVGSDAAGDVVAVGKDVSRVRPGMRVTDMYFPRWISGAPSAAKLAASTGDTAQGVFADYIVLDAQSVVPVPAGLSYEEAATLPTAGLTAFEATVGQNTIRPGSIVLVQGTGGVSTFALQFAAAAGARVIVTSSSDRKLERSQAIAAHESINYRKIPEWSHRVLELTHGDGADLIVDVGGKATLPQSGRCLAYGGTLSVVGGLTGYGGEIPAYALLGKVARAQGIYVGSRADFLRMDAFIEAHRVHPVIDRVFAFGDIDKAFAYMRAGHFIGKIVLRM